MLLLLLLLLLLWWWDSGTGHCRVVGKQLHAHCCAGAWAAGRWWWWLPAEVVLLLQAEELGASACMRRPLMMACACTAVVVVAEPSSRGCINVMVEAEECAAAGSVIHETDAVGGLDEQQRQRHATPHHDKHGRGRAQ